MHIRLTSAAAWVWSGISSAGKCRAMGASAPPPVLGSQPTWLVLSGRWAGPLPSAWGPQAHAARHAAPRGRALHSGTSLIHGLQQIVRLEHHHMCLQGRPLHFFLLVKHPVSRQFLACSVLRLWQCRHMRRGTQRRLGMHRPLEHRWVMACGTSLKLLPFDFVSALLMGPLECVWRLLACQE